MKTDPKIQELVDGYGNWFNDEAVLRSGRMTQNLYPYSSIFSPITINRTTIKNRLVMAPMGNISMCEETGRPNDKMLEYFFERAKGGVGLITSGLVPVSHNLDNSIIELGQLSYFPRIDRSRTVMAGWRDLVQGIHAYGAKFFIQLTPGLGRVGNPQCLVNSFKFPCSASLNPSFYIPQIPCLPLTPWRIRKIIKRAGQAAADAHACGIDGVYLHGHEGYLLEQFTNPAFNRRKFGRYSNWQAFGLDLVKEMRRRTNPHYPIMYRIDLSLALNETYGEDMNVKSLRKFKNGRTIDMTLDYMENLVKAGVDIFDVDLGCYDNWWLPHPPGSMPPGCFVEVAKIVKEHFASKKVLSNAGVEVPVVGVGKLGYPDLAEQTLRDGKCDMVMLGRPLLADPQWPNKTYAGKVADIRPCIGCQEGCINEFVEGGHPQCAVNPRTGFEHMMPSPIPPADKPKRIAVVGGGPGGMVCAAVAARRGHTVDLFEKQALGGRLVPGGVAKIKYEIVNYREYLERSVKLAEESGRLKLRREPASAQSLKDAGYDTVIMAVGSTEPGLKLAENTKSNCRVMRATELFLKPEALEGIQRAVVIGGGVVGCEAAYWLAYEHGIQTSVVEMTEYFMHHVCTANRAHLIYYLKKAGVKLLNCARFEGLGENGVHISRNVSSSVPNPYVTWHPILPENIENPLAPKIKEDIRNENIPAELVVVATGGKPDDALFFECQRINAAPQLYNIGDSFMVGKVLEAVRAAYRLALNL